jgi:hypothetical protein
MWWASKFGRVVVATQLGKVLKIKAQLAPLFLLNDWLL